MSDLRDTPGIGSGERRGRKPRDASSIIHAKIAWRALMSCIPPELSAAERQDWLSDLVTARSDALRLYTSGQRSISDSRQKQIAIEHPAIADVFRWPFWLFRRAKVNLREVRGWLDQYRDDYVLLEELPIERYILRDADGLPISVRCGDLMWIREVGGANAFFVLAAKFHEYGCLGLVDMQWRAGRYLISSMPSFCRNAHVRPYADNLIDLVEDLLRLLPRCALRYGVDRDAVLRQIEAEKALPAIPIVHYRQVVCEETAADLVM
jgi:hypothetical protein